MSTDDSPGAMNSPERRQSYGRRETDRLESKVSLWTVCVGLIIGAQAIAVFVLLGMFQSIHAQGDTLSAEQARLKESMFGAVRRCEELVEKGSRQ
jgi:hypothetical protein